MNQHAEVMTEHLAEDLIGLRDGRLRPNGGGWEIVIEDAETERRAIAARRTALKASIKLFRKKLEAGEPLPDGLQFSGQDQ